MYFEYGRNIVKFEIKYDILKLKLKEGEDIYA